MIDNVNNKLKFDDDECIYVGRPSVWGNPFIIGRDGNRDEVINKYRNWIYDDEQCGLRCRIRAELKGFTLLCHCYPKACHASVLYEIANDWGNDDEFEDFDYYYHSDIGVSG